MNLANPAIRAGGRGRATGLAVVALALWLAGCAAASRGAVGGGQVLYVVNSVDDTITQLDAASGRAAGPPLPAGTTPWQVAPGPPGSLLVASASPLAGQVTHVVRDGTGWRPRPVAVGNNVRAPLLAGDGGRHAAIAYRLRDAGPDGQRCWLALFDMLAGVVERAIPVCGPREWVTGMALESGPGGVVAYLGLAEGGPHGVIPGRVEAVQAATGAVLARFPLAGTPAHILLAPGPGGIGGRLYCVEIVQGPEHGEPPGDYPSRLLGLNPVTLDVESAHWLRARPGAIAVGPEGDHVYALNESGSGLVRLDLATGAEQRLARPGSGLGLAVTAEHVYVSNHSRNEVWALDRRHGRPARIIPVGRAPARLALSRRH